MLEQIELLNNMGRDLIAHAQKLTKTQDIESITRLALECFDKARAIEREISVNSVLFYTQVALVNGRKFSYQDYVDFCARNNLLVVAESDIRNFLLGVENCATKLG